jgi:beta-glucosidase-like glycosyl hydrolase
VNVLSLPTPTELSAEALVGQLICVSLRDYDGDRERRDRFLADLEMCGWGAVIVFGGELEAVTELLNEAQRRSPVPLLLTGDFERGFGQQFPCDGTVFPPLMALGAAADVGLAEAVGAAIGAELRAHGFHVDFAPVADLAIEPRNPIVATRAAGDDPGRVAPIVAATVEGLQSAGVAAAVKHFPGHGRTTTDSHHALPVVHATRDELEVTDWVVFRTGLRAGARIVMTTHVAFPALEPDGQTRPATFSTAVNEILKREWGFDGVICSDALMMGAVAGDAPEQAAQRALEAGVDWLLYPPDPAGVHRGLVSAIEDGRLDRARCERAAARLLRLKLWVLRRQSAGRASDPAALAGRTAGAALTALPTDPPSDHDWPDGAQWIVVLDGEIEPEDVRFAEWLAPEAGDRMVVIDTTQGEEQTRERIALARACSANSLVVCAVLSPIRASKGRHGLSDLGCDAVNAVTGPGRDTVLLIFSNPHIVAQVRAPSRVVWAYGEDPSSQRAALEFLRGTRPAPGCLPVQMPK